MSNPLHNLAHEFPEMVDTIQTLKTSNNHFKRLFDEYDEVGAALHTAGEGAGAISDVAAEDLKKKRLALKDELYAMLTASAAAA